MRQTVDPFFCLRIFTAFFSVLFLKNITAQEIYPYYTNTLNWTRFTREGTIETVQTVSNRLLIRNLSFEMNVHGKKYKTVGILSTGVVYLAETFEYGSPIRALQILNANSTLQSVVIQTFDTYFIVVWFNVNYCPALPARATIVFVVINQNGTIQYSSTLPSRFANCNMTVQFTDGIYNGSADGNGNIVSGNIIHRMVYPGSITFNANVFAITPVARCPVQTSCATCVAESLANEKCIWCPRYEKCEYENITHWNSSVYDACSIINSSQCDDLAQTQSTTNSQSRVTAFSNICVLIIVLGLFCRSTSVMMIC